MKKHKTDLHWTELKTHHNNFLHSVVSFSQRCPKLHVNVKGGVNHCQNFNFNESIISIKSMFSIFELIWISYYLNSNFILIKKYVKSIMMSEILMLRGQKSVKSLHETFLLS